MKKKEIRLAAAHILCAERLIWQSDTDQRVNSKTYPQYKGFLALIKQEIKEMLHTRAGRMYNKPQNHLNRDTLRDSFLRRYIAPLDLLYPLKTYTGKWAGGENHFRAIHKKNCIPSIEVQSFRQWSDNGKWSGLSGSFTVAIDALRYRYDVIGGLLTVWRKADTGSKPCWWFEQSRGMEVKTVEGFLVRGYHVKKTATINSLEKAIAVVAKKRTQAAKSLWQKRAEQHLDRAKKQEIMQMLARVWISEADSIAAGNCPAGTAAFRKRYEASNGFGTIGAVRADVLITHANGNTTYVKRAIRHKTGLAV